MVRRCVSQTPSQRTATSTQLLGTVDIVEPPCTVGRAPSAVASRPSIRPPRPIHLAMSLRFISTEVLSSTDGLSHGETTTLETEEVAAAKRQQACSSGKTLRASRVPRDPAGRARRKTAEFLRYEQLEAEKAKQQEAYDANTKAIFAPNQALDDEDVEFFESEQRRRRQALAARDEVEASAFERLREGAGAAAPPPALKIAAAPSKPPAPPAPPLSKIRRRPAGAAAPAQKRARADAAGDAGDAGDAASPAPNPLASLACYDDSDSD